MRPAQCNRSRQAVSGAAAAILGWSCVMTIPCRSCCSGSRRMSCFTLYEVPRAQRGVRCKLARVENALAQALLTALHASPTRRSAARAGKDAAAAEDVNAMLMCRSCSSCLEYEYAVSSKRHMTALQTSP